MTISTVKRTKSGHFERILRTTLLQYILAKLRDRRVYALLWWYTESSDSYESPSLLEPLRR
jgi:hypothetical protein